MPPTAVTIGGFAIALLAIFGTMDYYRIAADANERQPDMYRVSYQGARFREVLERIPADAVVGYDTNLESGALQDDVAFRGAQYAAAPRLLRRVARGEYGDFVIGNYTNEVTPRDMIARAEEEFDLELVQALDSGVVLYRKRGSR